MKAASLRIRWTAIGFHTAMALIGSSEHRPGMVTINLAFAAMHLIIASYVES